MTAHNRSGRLSAVWIRPRRRNIQLLGEDSDVEYDGTTKQPSWKMIEKMLNRKRDVLQLRVYRLQQSGGGGGRKVL